MCSSLACFQKTIQNSPMFQTSTWLHLCLVVVEFKFEMRGRMSLAYVPKQAHVFSCSQNPTPPPNARLGGVFPNGDPETPCCGYAPSFTYVRLFFQKTRFRNAIVKEGPWLIMSGSRLYPKSTTINLMCPFPNYTYLISYLQNPMSYADVWLAGVFLNPNAESVCPKYASVFAHVCWRTSRLYQHVLMFACVVSKIAVRELTCASVPKVPCINGMLQRYPTTIHVRPCACV
jgi:hypothetical protein